MIIACLRAYAHIVCSRKISEPHQYTSSHNNLQQGVCLIKKVLCLIKKVYFWRAEGYVTLSVSSRMSSQKRVSTCSQEVVGALQANNGALLACESTNVKYQHFETEWCVVTYPTHSNHACNPVMKLVQLRAEGNVRLTLLELESDLSALGS